MEKRRRSAKFSSQEINVLLNSLRLDPDLAGGKIGGKYKSLQEQNAVWSAIAARVNAVGFGENRSYEDMRRKWKDLKYVSKKHALQLQTDRKGTRGGVPLPLPLTPLEETVLDILNSSCFNGETPEENNTTPQITEVRSLSFKNCSNGSSTDSLFDNYSSKTKGSTKSPYVQILRAQKRKLASGCCSEEKSAQTNNNQEINHSLYEIAVHLKEIKTIQQEYLDLKKKELKLKCMKHGIEFDEL